MGGMFSLRLAQLVPDRIERMVLMGSGGMPGLVPLPGLIKLVTFYDDPSEQSMEELLMLFVSDKEAFGPRIRDIAAERHAVASPRGRPAVASGHLRARRILDFLRGGPGRIATGPWWCTAATTPSCRRKPATIWRPTCPTRTFMCSATAATGPRWSRPSDSAQFSPILWKGVSSHDRRHDQGRTTGPGRGNAGDGSTRRESIADRARAAAPALAAADGRSGSLRRLSDESWHLIADTGILRALQPKRWGGGETSVADFAEGVVEIGRASASAGWVSSVVGVHPWQIALFPEETQEDVWGGNPTRASPRPIRRPGRSKRSPAGTVFRAAGRSPPGIERCDGVILGSIDGEREINGARVPRLHLGRPRPRPVHALKIVWHTAGLKGTGSNNIIVKDAFVPAHRVQSHLDYTKGLGTPLPGQDIRNTAALYRVPWAVLFNLIITAGALGAVYGFLDLWTAETAGRRTNYGTLLRDEAMVQDHLAEATFAIDGARLRGACGTGTARDRRSDEIPSEELRAFYRWDLARSAQSAVDAVSDLMRSASGRTAFIEHPLHGKFQDVMAASGHAFLFSDPLGRAYAGRKLGSTKVPAVHL